MSGLHQKYSYSAKDYLLQEILILVVLHSKSPANQKKNGVSAYFFL